jgi:hypothetical protein
VWKQFFGNPNESDFRRVRLGGRGFKDAAKEAGVQYTTPRNASAKADTTGRPERTCKVRTADQSAAGALTGGTMVLRTAGEGTGGTFF